MRGHFAGLVAAMAVLMGCSTSAPEPNLPPVVTAAPGERVATFGLEDATAWPYWLHRVEVRVGDDTVVDERFGPDASQPRWLVHARLPPGEHEVVVVAEVAYASTRVDGSDGCVVRLELHAALDLRQDHAAVDVGLRHRGGATTPFTERIALELAARQGALVPGARSRLGPTAAICDDRAPLVETSPPLRGSRSLWRTDQAAPTGGSPWPDGGW